MVDLYLWLMGEKLFQTRWNLVWNRFIPHTSQVTIYHIKVWLILIISTMGIPMLARQHLCIQSACWGLFHKKRSGILALILWLLICIYTWISYRANFTSHLSIFKSVWNQFCFITISSFIIFVYSRCSLMLCYFESTGRLAILLHSFWPSTY